MKGEKRKLMIMEFQKNPEISKDLKEALEKSKKAKKKIESLSPSGRRVFLRWIEYAKTPEAKKKRISSVVKMLSKGKYNPWRLENKK